MKRSRYTLIKHTFNVTIFTYRIYSTNILHTYKKQEGTFFMKNKIFLFYINISLNTYVYNMLYSVYCDKYVCMNMYVPIIQLILQYTIVHRIDETTF